MTSTAVLTGALAVLICAVILAFAARDGMAALLTGLGLS